MLVLGVCIIGLLLLAGVINTTYVWRGYVVPVPFAITHGVLAVLGLAVLTAAVITGPVMRPVNAGVVFLVLTAIGGLLLLSLRPGGKPQPLLLAILHGLLGIAGFGLLLVGLFQR